MLALYNNHGQATTTWPSGRCREPTTTGSDNIYLGASVLASRGESNTIYLGGQGTQTKTFIAGIRGITTGAANAVPVVIDSNGQLGTVSSSIRFKEDIHDMADASRRLLQLRPVTFRYTQAYSDGAKPIQYGLIAEEVAEVFPGTGGARRRWPGGDRALRNAERPAPERDCRSSSASTIGSSASSRASNDAWTSAHRRTAAAELEALERLLPS